MAAWQMRKDAAGFMVHPSPGEPGRSGNLLGDGTPAGSNTIAFNGLDGVDVDDGCTGDGISRNSIFSNGGLGIDLRGSGENFNDATSEASNNASRAEPEVIEPPTVAARLFPE